tara:strand:+ start:4846 stop:7464 length:2619 start_codon:yes stop_codon:yes gene_type:complete
LVTGLCITLLAIGCSAQPDRQENQIIFPLQEDATSSAAQNWTDLGPNVSHLGATNIVIQDGQTVVFDAAHTKINKLIITDGTFKCKDDGVHRVLETKGIMLNGSNARFECDLSGNSESTLEIKFYGNIEFPGSELHCSDNHMHNHDNTGQQSFLVLCGATLDLKGYDRGPSWVLTGDGVDVNQDSKGPIQIAPSRSIQNWKAGDEIVIAPSSPNPMHTKKYTISNITGNELNITTRLKKEIRSKTMSYRYNQTLDQRVEVANLTRNIKIRGEKLNDKSYHMMFMQPGRIKIESVEFIGGGHMGDLARYPIHWHIAGNRQGDYIKKSSIHDTEQRCITIHGTHRVRLEDNVCYNHVGHGFFLEDGDEQHNILKNNLAINGIKPKAGKVLLHSDLQTSSKRYKPVAGFWISNPNNLLEGNAAVGEGTGFWYALKSADSLQGRIASLTPAPINTPIRLFRNNRAHANGVGLTIDGGPNNDCSSEDSCTNAESNMFPTGTNYEPTASSVIEGFIAYKNKEFGLWVRSPGGNTVVRNSIAGDNYVNFGLVFDQLLENSVVVGKSANMTDEDMGFLVNRSCTDCSTPPTVTELVPASGLVLYDGPISLKNVEFADYPTSLQLNLSKTNLTNYDIAPVPFVLTGAAAMRSSTHRVEGVTFSNAPGAIGDFAHTFNHASKKNWAAGLYDVDGTYSGHANHTVKSDMPMNVYPDCKRDTKLRNAVICPGVFGLFGIVKETFQANITRVDRLLNKRVLFDIDNQPYSQPDNNNINQFSFSHVVGGRFKYVIEPSSSDAFENDGFVTYGKLGEWSPWFDFRHKAHRCELLNSASTNHRIQKHTDTQLIFRVKYTTLDRRTSYNGDYRYKATFRIKCAPPTNSP